MGNVLTIIGAIIGVLFIGVIGLVAYFRISAAMLDKRLRTYITTYAEERGATVRFDERGVQVDGPLGSGHETLTALRIMVEGKPTSEWETSVGFYLRSYVPDAFHAALAKAAKERLEKYGPEVAALSDDALRERLRVQVVASNTSSEGLATCARRLSDRYEARVVVEGIDLSGLPNADRGRLPEADDALLELALAQTLSAPPSNTQCDDQGWLCRPADLFGDAPTIAVGVETGLAWIPASPDALPQLAALCGRSSASGPMKAVMWFWDGSRELVEDTIVVHTIIGPNTPDYTLTLPRFIQQALGVDAPKLGVRR